MSVFDLTGRKALVTGGARGLGSGMAAALADAGASVAIGDIAEDLGKATVEELKANGKTAEFIQLDVTSESDWQSAVTATVTAFGKLDLLVNNAGISGTFDPDMTSTAAWDALMSVNAKGVFLGMKYAVPDPTSLPGLLAGVGPGRWVWVCGLAEMWAPYFWVGGARGFTSGLVNVAPASETGWPSRASARSATSNPVTGSLNVIVSGPSGVCRGLGETTGAATLGATVSIVTRRAFPRNVSLPAAST